MRSQIQIKDNLVVNRVNLEDGTYNCSFSKKTDDKTLEQVRKLWATIGDISKKLYGDTSEKDSIYIQILQMAGQRTYQVTMEEDAIDDFKKNKTIKCISIKSREVIGHKAYVLMDVCMTGISEMDKKEVSQVIESCIKYANECGVIPQVERES